MNVELINIYPISLPFLMNISHALNKMAYSENIVVEVLTDEGKTKGYGEGIPRTYVTGDSQAEAVANVQQLIQTHSFPWSIEGIFDIWNFVDQLPDEKKYHPSICALEMALLDVWGKKNQQNLINLFPHDFFISKIYYGGGFPLGEHQKLRERCRLFRELKINRIKLKMGSDLKKNEEALEIISEVFRGDFDLKIDANCSWNDGLGLKHIPLLKKYQVTVVEQPMFPDDPNLAEFAEALEEYGILLMADESACSFDEVKKIIDEGYFKMVNIRLSKLGGFRRSLKIIDFLRRENKFFQVGCHLGESGILSAAGRILSCLCRDSLYYDGSYDSFLLKMNITRENVSFGPEGEAGPLEGPGLGVIISENNLRRLTTGPVVQITP